MVAARLHALHREMSRQQARVPALVREQVVDKGLAEDRVSAQGKVSREDKQVPMHLHLQNPGAEWL